MSLILITAANRPYMERIAPYLGTIQEYGAGFDRKVLISVGCVVEMPEALSSIAPIPLPAHLARGHTGNWCIQQGCFLDVLDCADDDVLVFTDGDIRMQRGPSEAELSWLSSIPPDTIALAWNGGPGDMLANEAARIELDDEGAAMFAGVMHRNVYNVGVIVCRAGTYRQIYERYMQIWPTFAPHTAHYARNQFLMCAAIHELGLLVWEMHPTMHTHGCFGLPGWARDEAGVLTVQGVPVLFKHHYNC
jgi:hypothetical protein